MELLSSFKQSVRVKDLKQIADQVRQFRKGGLDDGGIFRLALAGDEGLTRDHWADLVELALERNPKGTPQERFPLRARVETSPCTDQWMQGDRFGTVTGHKDALVRVKLDISKKSLWFEARQLRDDRLGKV